MQPKHSFLILIAGPYRSGTNDDPARIHANVKAMTDIALEVYKMGHLPKFPLYSKSPDRKSLPLHSYEFYRTQAR